MNVKKEDILAKLLLRDNLIKNYVFLCEDITGRYLKYAFIDGYPENFNMLPQWSTELPANDGSIYELSGYTGDHWVFKDSKPINVDKLMHKQFTLTVDEMWEMFS